MTKPVTIQRDQLYKKIWKEPASKLAEMYGISGSMVARICDELNVPRPKRGHWMKLQYGHSVKTLPLPPLKEGQKDTWVISQTNVKAQREVQVVKSAVKELPVDESIEHILHGELKAHPAIGETKRALKAEKPDKYGRIFSRLELRHLNVRVSEHIQERSYLFLNRFLHLCAYHGLKLGCDLDTDPDRRRGSYGRGGRASGELYLKWDEFTLGFNLKELCKVSKTTDSGKYSWDQYDYNPSGRLEFVLDRCWALEGPTTWKDGKIKRVEDSLVMMAGQVKKYFDGQFERREEKRRQEKLRHEREAYEEFMKDYRTCWNNQRRIEKGVLNVIRGQAKLMKQADRLRVYIKACETRMAELEAMGDPPSQSDCLKLNWLKTRLEMLDPFVVDAKPWDIIPQSVANGGGA